MSIGMSYDEFWFGEPYLTVIYYKLHELRNKQKNEELWLQGAYVYQAMQTVMYNAFRKKGQQGETYLKEPFKLDTHEEITEEQRKEERTKVIDFFNNFKNSWDKKHG